jgi:hypothetical protein
MGEILKARVPVWKQVNLYQNGLISERRPGLQEGELIPLPPHNGTLFWVKVEFPQTGKAVDGFCPGAVQGVWAVRQVQNRTRERQVSKNFMR